ncbi:alpha/beta hydrolase fold domain-containing protein [Arthrobacter sp. OY3WO11]|uniref:alpha/beta hydrolase fold domain-containing protein n=1 Tax=Arthrobacter sp. OY3WO11 TaxID=1835723 RepID=UPI0025708229|nr:alpha/beta hydrolase fold domain-containing protein [Arthrobacter sp. OY3WO11]
MRDPRLPLPPGTRFPVPMEDVMDVFHTINTEHEKVLLGGASAGACLTTAATMRLRDEGKQQPHGLFLAYGTFHAALPSLSPVLQKRVRGHHGIFQFRPSTVRRMNLNYAGSKEAMSHPHAFPGGHDLKGFPQTLVLDADRDTLRASGEALATELAAAGVNATYQVIAESTHGFLDRPHTASFRLGIATVSTWLKANSR